MGNAIEIVGLRKEYRRRGGRTVAVDGLDLEVPEGGVYGFLGPNGSGKTTTIRCLLGLVRPTRGQMRVLGRAVPAELATAISHVGAIVESPALFPTMTGRENLRLLAGLDRIDKRRVDEVLTTVGLAPRGADLVKRYSLGMRQRLALAAALLKDPALLVLDEPANGLDPAGIREIRELLCRLGREGRTVFVSSHLLSEVEQTCDHVAILSRGRCVAQGTVAEVLDSADAAPTMIVRVGDLAAAAAVLKSVGLGVERRNGHLRVAAPATEAARISSTLGAAGHWVTELRAEERHLEDLFLELTGEGAPALATQTPSVFEEVAS
jgi:ABC-2 type transport system ATP-binding protein